jgi:hypothetical protein
MRAAWIAVLAIGVTAGAVARAVVGDMAREEARTRLGRIPFALIRLAAARVPRELRDDLPAEWKAELEFLLADTDGLPLTRLLRGIRFSVGLLISAREITDELTGEDKGTWQLIRLIAGSAYAVLGSGGVVTGIVLATEHAVPITEFVGGASMAAAWLVIGIIFVRGRFTGVLSACGCLLVCASNLAFYLHHADVVRLAAAAFFACAASAPVVLKLQTRRWDGHLRQYQELRDAHAALYPECTECFGPQRA